MTIRSKKTENSESEHHVTVIICALNEEKNLIQVIPKIPQFIDETILVDGHSVDQTIHAREFDLDTKGKNFSMH